MAEQRLRSPGGIGFLGPKEVGDQRPDKMAGDPELLLQERSGVVGVEALGGEAEEIHAVELGHAVGDLPGGSIAEHMRVEQSAGERPEVSQLLPSPGFRLAEVELPLALRGAPDLAPNAEAGKVALAI